MLEPGDVLIDCTGSRSLLRDHLAPTAGAVEPDANTLNFVFEHALVITFLYSQEYSCNEYCKYYKNAENPRYKFIPMVHRVSYDGNVSHVTGIVTITAEEYAAMPKQFNGEWLRDNFPSVAESMDRFIDKIRQESNGEIIGDLEIIRIPLNLYRARNATSRQWRERAGRPPVRHRAGLPGRRLGDRLSLLPVDLAWLRVRDVLGGPHRAAALRPQTCSIATNSTSTSSGSACTCRAR